MQFQITDLDQGEIGLQDGRANSPYCLFSDKGGQCIVRRFSQMGNKWPGTAVPRGQAETTRTAVTITIVPRNGDRVLDLAVRA